MILLVVSNYPSNSFIDDQDDDIGGNVSKYFVISIAN